MDGLLTALDVTGAEGPVTITAQAGDLKAQCAVTVVYPPNVGYEVSLPQQRIGVVGEEIRIPLTVKNVNNITTFNAFDITLTYDPENGDYAAAQHGGSYVDGNTWKTVHFRNVVVMRCATGVQSGGQLLTVQTTGSGTGYFACDGKLIPIRWSRSSVTEPIRFTTESGEPVVFGVGSTYIAVVPNGASVVTE